MKRLTLAAGAVLVLVGVAACTGTGIGGQPEPGSTTTTSTGGDPTTPTSGAGGVAAMNACSFLTASEAASVGLPSAGSTQNAGAKSGCEWDGTQYIVIVGIRTDVGLAGVLANGGTITNTQIGSRQAKQLTESAGGCLYAIGIDASTRVDVEAGPISNSNSACSEALAVAQLVEKHLS